MRLILALMGLLIAGPAFADHDNTSATDAGTYIKTTEVVVSSIAGTAAFAADSKRMKFELRSLDAGAVYIGTNTATQHAPAVAGNILAGLPFYSTSPYKSDGKFSGTLALTAERGIASIRVRVIEHLNQ